MGAGRALRTDRQTDTQTDVQPPGRQGGQPPPTPARHPLPPGAGKGNPLGSPTPCRTKGHPGNRDTPPLPPPCPLPPGSWVPIRGDALAAASPLQPPLPGWPWGLAGTPNLPLPGRAPASYSHLCSSSPAPYPCLAPSPLPGCLHPASPPACLCLGDAPQPCQTLPGRPQRGTPPRPPHSQGVTQVMG